MEFDTKVISRSTCSKAQLRSYAFYVKLVMHIKTNATLIPMKSFRTSLMRTCECYQKVMNVIMLQLFRTSGIVLQWYLMHVVT